MTKKVKMSSVTKMTECVGFCEYRTENTLLKLKNVVSYKVHTSFHIDQGRPGVGGWGWGGG